MDLHQFVDELYGEHLEEAAALYDQWRTLRFDVELAWSDLAFWESRLAAHLDALAIGGEEALAVCARGIGEGDAGELFAAVANLCRQDRFDVLEKALTGLDLSDEERAAALGDALVLEAPEPWLTRLAQLASGEPALAPVAIRLLGWRRSRAGDAFLAQCREDAGLARPLAWTYGRIGDQGAVFWLQRLFDAGDDADLLQTVAVALLRLDQRHVVERLRAEAAAQAWALRPLALCGDASDGRRLAERARQQGLPGLDGLPAIGLLGDPSGLPLLVSYLRVPQVAAEAAMALNLMTGAELFEEAFVPEEVDEDELFDDEIEKVRQGETLTNADGSPAGETVRRPCQDPGQWRAWLKQHADRFPAGQRVRYGRPFGPESALLSLAVEATPNRLRAWLPDELLIRHGFDVPLELEMTVPAQQRLIQAAKK